MQIEPTIIPGCFQLFPQKQFDVRGNFVKIYNENIYKELNLKTDFKEEYYSTSVKNVLRGLHFQIPPKEHEKVVYCVWGEVFDVVVDLRKNSPMYGKFQSFNLSSDKANMLYISAGLAHGFYVLSDISIMIYKTTSLYSPQHDSGILWNSVDINWPSDNPIVSSRDKSFSTLSEYKSPFIFKG